MQPREITRHNVAAFLEQTASWGEAERRAFAREYCEALDRAGESSWKVPHPLLDQLLYPALMAWVGEASDARPHRWLAIHFREYVFRKQQALYDNPVLHHLQRALELDPHEQPARIELVRYLIDSISFAAHHLPDYYIGEPDEAVEAAQGIPALIEGIEDPQRKAQLSDWLAYELQLVADWKQFNAEGGKDFAAWCRERGRDYHWMKSYYFKK